MRQGAWGFLEKGKLMKVLGSSKHWVPIAGVDGRNGEFMRFWNVLSFFSCEAIYVGCLGLSWKWLQQQISGYRINGTSAILYSHFSM
jgi:hypothetical protein